MNVSLHDINRISASFIDLRDKGGSTRDLTFYVHGRGRCDMVSLFIQDGAEVDPSVIASLQSLADSLDQDRRRRTGDPSDHGIPEPEDWHESEKCEELREPK